MEVRATKNNGEGFAIFTWNQDLTECKTVAVMMDDSEMDLLIENKVHEGLDFEGWTVRIR